MDDSNRYQDDPLQISFVQASMTDGCVIPLGDLPEGERTADVAPIIPITIRKMVLLQDVSRDGHIRVYGVRPSAVVIVGMVERLSWYRGVCKLQINDATGRVMVRLITGPGRHIVIPRDWFGQYVMLAGLPFCYWSTGGWDFEAFSSRKATALEVAYHTIESVHAMLSLQRLQDDISIQEAASVIMPAMAVERRPRHRRAVSSQDPMPVGIP